MEYNSDEEENLGVKEDSNTLSELSKFSKLSKSSKVLDKLNASEEEEDTYSGGATDGGSNRDSNDEYVVSAISISRSSNEDSDINTRRGRKRRKIRRRY